MKFLVSGMTCAACVARVEKFVNKVDGVKECSVSLLTNSMNVVGQVAPEKIISAVQEAGYEAKIFDADGAAQTSSQDAALLEDTESPKIKRRLLWSVFLLIVLLIFSMGHMMFGLPLPAFFDGNELGLGIVQLVLAALIMVINQKFFINGIKSLLMLSPNMDTLVALGSLASFGYSVFVLLMMTLPSNQIFSAKNFYFESAAMIVTLITVGKFLEAKTKGKTTDALKSLMKLAPKTATILEDGEEKIIPIENVLVGNIFLVKPGEVVPVDGEILFGESALDESSLTGESLPIDKKIGDKIFSGTLNQTGVLHAKAFHVGKETTLSQIIQLVEDANATKAPIAKLADTVAGVFVPVVIGLAILTCIVWLVLGENFQTAFMHGIAVLVISCPCALGLATPVAIMAGSGQAARHGILFKNSRAMELSGKIKFVAMDKTGTITKGKPTVTDLFCENDDEKNFLQIAYALEKNSQHPLAEAVKSFCQEKINSIEKNFLNSSEFKEEAGKGVSMKIEQEKFFAGNQKFVPNISQRAKEFSQALANEGKTILFFASEKKFFGCLAVADVIKDDAKEAIAELKSLGIGVAMITGDNRLAAQSIAKQAGIPSENIFAEVLPSGKEKIIRAIQENVQKNFGKETKIAFVGDGINDAPALARADLGIAIGAGTDIAIDAADVVLMKNHLMDLVASFKIGRATLKTIRENLFWAFFYNVIGIPLAAGAFVKFFGWSLSPMFGAAAMSLSSVSVVSNALRLNFFNPYRKNHSSAKSETILFTELHEKGEETMQKILKIEGMMCGHCEARVQKALEKLDGVDHAEASHEKGTATVTLSKDVANDVLKEAVESQDYKVLEIV